MGLFRKNGFIYCVVTMLVLLSSGLCFAFGGKVSFPDGTPAVGATVTYTDESSNRQSVNCDVTGRFQFAQVSEGDSRIQISAPDGKNFAPVVLPAAVFGSGETAIVLQPK